MKFYLNGFTFSHLLVFPFWRCLWRSLLWNLRIVNDNMHYLNGESMEGVRIGDGEIDLDYYREFEVYKIGQLGSAVWIHFVRKHKA